MEKKEREILLKELCSRLPYKPTVYYEPDDIYLILIGIECISEEKIQLSTTMSGIDSFYYDISDVKLCLRRISSLTRYEKDHLTDYWNTDKNACAKIDYYNANGVDYRGLIDMGLAIEAPEGMYKEE